MSLDLYERETRERMADMPPVKDVDPGIFDGFLRGTGLTTMRYLARAGRSIDLAGAIGPIATDAITGGTEAQDRYFREHDEVWGSAVDHWTAKPGEVGIAGEITGQLIATLPLVLASPAFAVAEMQLGTAEDLVRKGADAGKAQAVGAVQAAGLGLGIWAPILGRTGFERMVVGGAGFNVLQGVTTRSASGLILDGTPQAEEFKAFDGTALTLDVLLGLAFGGWAHLNPEMRAQGRAAWERIGAWAQRLQPSDIAAIAALRQAQHMNEDSAPAKPATPADVERHVARMRQTIEQVSRDEAPEVNDLPAPKFEGQAEKPDADAGVVQLEPDRLAEAEKRTEALQDAAERVQKQEDLPPVPEPDVATERAQASAKGESEAEQAMAIGNSVREQLGKVGRPPEEADAAAALWEAFYKTTAARLGITPRELHDRFPVDITGEAAKDGPVLAQEKNTWWYSELGRQIDAAKMKAAPAQAWKDILKSFASKGVKGDEIKWSGLEEWLDLQQGKVTKEQVADFLKNNGVRVEEVMLGGEGQRTISDDAIRDDVDALKAAGFEVQQHPEDPQMYAFEDINNGADIVSADEIKRYAAQGEVTEEIARAAERVESYLMRPAARAGNPTKFGQYQLPGGKNYRELLLTLPHDPERLPKGYRIQEKQPDAIPGDAQEKLIAEYKAFSDAIERRMGFKLGSADEHTSDGRLSPDERSFLNDFVTRWDEAVYEDNANRQPQYILIGPDGTGTLLRASNSMEEAMDHAMRHLDNTGALDKVVFRESHWNEPNVLAHVRFNERVDADGKKVLFVEEIQSDWAQKGKRQGFQMPEGTPAELRAKQAGPIPAAPFVAKTEAWVGLVLKRMIAYAVENGFERVAWTTGEQQTSRYTNALRHAVDEIHWTKTEKGVQIIGYKSRAVGADHSSRQKVVDTTEKEDVLSDAIGKAMADKIISDPNQEGVISGDGIVVADTGMASFYDRMVPNIANDLLKKLGGKRVGQTKIDSGTITEAPTMTPFDREHWMTYGGAEQFGDGKDPLIGSTQIEVDGVKQPADVNIDGAGVHVITHDGEHEFITRWGQLAGTGHPIAGGIYYNREGALELFARAWKEPGSPLWTAAEDLGTGGRMEMVLGASEQLSFDITPDMKAKIEGGVPLFQKTGGKHRGYLSLGDGKRQIGLLEEANASTFVHESGHFFLDVTSELAASPDAPAALRADLDRIYTWFGVKDAQSWGEMTLEEKRPYHEKFARGFEAYLRDGVAPTEALRGAFQRFRDWLVELYRSAKSLNVKLTDEVRGVLDRMLALQEAEGPAAKPGGTEPPPPRGSRQVEAAGPDAAAGKGKFFDESFPEPDNAPVARGLDDQQVRSMLEYMAKNEAGWAEIGGRKRNPSAMGGVVDFTQWIPKAEWWRTRPAKLNEQQTMKAINKALAGEPLSKPEDRMVRYMVDVANDRLASVQDLGAEEWAAVAEDIRLYGLEHSTQNVLEADLVARASELDDVALERASIQYENDPASFMAEVRRIVNGAEQSPAATRSGPADRGAPGARAEGEGPKQGGQGEEAKAPDALKATAERFVAENPDRLLRVGTNADGSPIVRTAAEFLEEARLDVKQAREDAKLFELAAQCLLGGK